MGGVLHTLNPRLFDDQLEYIVNHAEDRVLIYDRAFTSLVERMKPRWTTMEHYICFDDDFAALLAAEDGDYRWHEALACRPVRVPGSTGTFGDWRG